VRWLAVYRTWPPIHRNGGVNGSPLADAAATSFASLFSFFILGVCRN